METSALTMERSEAKVLYEKYQSHIHFGEAIDREVARAYRLLAQGKLIIRALESVKAAGLNEEGLPKLAIIRADAKECRVVLDRDGSAKFVMKQWDRSTARQIVFPSGTFSPPLDTFPFAWRTQTERAWTHEARAIVPIVPLHLRPKHSMSNYHILWEADWHAVPRDPYLLRRLGKGDLWLVLAMWDLTEVERAALQARV